MFAKTRTANRYLLIRWGVAHGWFVDTASPPDENQDLLIEGAMFERMAQLVQGNGLEPGPLDVSVVRLRNGAA